jgi:hypothetical protein
LYGIISVLRQSAIVLDFDVLELKHENDQVSPSHRVTIVDVLDQIEEKIAVTKGLS